MAKKNQIRKQDILDYHEGARPGKIEVIPSKPSNSQRDLSIAYSPGVAEPCKEIEKDPETAYQYTAKGNLVAVISNGTAVLGLGDIGPLASKPVMEGKGVLFKIFADIDTFDLELDAKDPETFIQTVKALGPTFGGINLEDIKAPDCFEIEQRLKEELDIPVMHDDQHGTAIISGAALLNALSLVEKDIAKVRVVFNGAGASAVSCASLYLSLGVKKENLLMLDSKGVITTDRENLTPEKQKFAADTKLNTLEEAVKDADVFVGLSRGGVLSKAMVKSMAKDPIVFALANPDPEITYEDAIAARKDIIMATGRSDNPNQVNNVLGFPFIFRGALDVRATKINEEMKLAATYAIANLAKETVPEIVNLAYGMRNMSFGREYIIPKPFDPRLIHTVAMAVAKAAMESGVAKKEITNWDRYKEELITRLGRDDKFIRLAMEKARANPQRVVFSEADNFKMLKAAQIAYEEGIAIPILLGDEKRIKQIDKQYDLGIAENMEIVDPRTMPEKGEVYAKQFYDDRKRKGVTEYEARRLMKNRDYYGPMMVKHGDADAFITGLTIKYPRAVRPLLEIFGQHGQNRVAGMYIMLTKRGPLFFADTTINEEPDVDGIVDIVLSVAETVKRINLKPKVALLSYSNFGSHHGKVPSKMNQAVEKLKQTHPDLIVDGEMQANFAVNNKLLEEVFPFSDLVNHKPNIFIFPDLASGNISYKLLQSLGAAEAIGPILIGLDKAAHVLQMGASVREIVNIVAMAVVDAQTRKE
ncbi:NADP-dependent malic enzyme [Phaeocystidibacter luteus]|uniref:NADP-dependent malic enzyme n=1 Tax=Phaeocystidibacter luteus TaxID=911197 RepID=A0A6N6RI93_9FLAO|nr:NADP-dependent malic enzyme [Phaeocystidibacter luteus]KAB2814045.1 NADP-dependent malic enzyme [Phaeocystidibacter luteus]